VHGASVDQVTGLIVLFVLGAFTLFFRRLIRDLDDATKAIAELRDETRKDIGELRDEVHLLGLKVARITERDRNRRLSDYDENSNND
jgi:hypothetical protein